MQGSERGGDEFRNGTPDRAGHAGIGLDLKRNPEGTRNIEEVSQGSDALADPPVENNMT